MIVLIIKVSFNVLDLPSTIYLTPKLFLICSILASGSKALIARIEATLKTGFKANKLISSSCKPVTKY